MFTLFALETVQKGNSTVYSLYVENTLICKSRKIKVKFDSKGVAKFSVSILSLTQSKTQLQELSALLISEIDKHNNDKLQDMFTEVDALPILQIV